MHMYLYIRNVCTVYLCSERDGTIERYTGRKGGREKEGGRKSVHNFEMDIPNLLNCLMLTRNTHLSLPPPLSSSIFLSSSPSPFLRLSFPLYLSLLLYPLFLSFLTLSSSFLLSSSLPPCIPFYLSIPL